MASIPSSLLYPTPSPAAVKAQFVGKNIRDVPAPAVVVDVAKARRNCRYMLDTAAALGLSFRAHVKTHKTVEAARIQVGENSNDIRLLCSTVAEAECLMPWLLEAKQAGKKVNLIYGLPLVLSNISRLARLARTLGSDTITVLVDHPEQVDRLGKDMAGGGVEWPGQVPVMIKVDAGYHRAGIKVASPLMHEIVNAAASAGRIRIAGIYAHMGHSYSSSSPTEALNYLKDELRQAIAGAEAVLPLLGSFTPEGELLVSIGATPTATAVQNLSTLTTPEAQSVRALIEAAQQRFELEIHAGVYPFLDMQQLATRARPSTIDNSPRLDAASNLALRVMVEVASVYDERERPEALIAAGSIVMGREPCKSYDGWAVVTPWRESGVVEGGAYYDPSADDGTGWIVGRISQEHGILTWKGPAEQVRRLKVGEKLLLWPNHACMAGPNFGCYYVVDSENEEGGPDEIVDVWVRGRGW